MDSPERNARELLAFYRDAGVDALLGDEPVDRFADEFDRPAPKPAASFAAAAFSGDEPTSPSLPRKGGGSTVGAPAAIAAAPPSAEAAVMSARAAAKSAESLDALRALLQAFEGCMLRTTATQLVFADGNPKGRVMFVGEAPGRDEDIEGLPFVGRSGKLLDRMIGAIGLDRTKAYIANVIPWRPPGNRTPTPQETQICLPFVQRQIELVDPDVLVTLGNPSTQTLLGTREGIMRTRGRWFDYNTGTRVIRALPTFHPAYLLRSPAYKRLAWQDLLAIAKVLRQGS
jgi:uracil-DNA glycosylase family 4